MPITVVQVVNEDVKVVNGFRDLYSANEHVNNMKCVSFNNTSKTLHSVLSPDETITMDGYYIQKTDSEDLFNIIKRTTEINPGWFTTSVDQKMEKIGFIKLVDDDQQVTSSKTSNNNNNNEFIIVHTPKVKSKKSFAFPVKVTKEFMAKVKEREQRQEQKLTKAK